MKHTQAEWVTVVPSRVYFLLYNQKYIKCITCCVGPCVSGSGDKFYSGRCFLSFHHSATGRVVMSNSSWLIKGSSCPKTGEKKRQGRRLGYKKVVCRATTGTKWTCMDNKVKCVGGGNQQTKEDEQAEEEEDDDDEEEGE